MIIELHKQQLEFQQFTLQKTELQQKQLEELPVNSLNGSKNSEKDPIFSESTIYNSIDTLEYAPENNKTFEEDEDIFNVYCEQWPSKKKKKKYVYYYENREQPNIILPKKTTDFDFSETIKLLWELFGSNTTLFHKLWKCLNTVKDNQTDFLTFAASVKKLCNDFKLAELTADDFKCTGSSISRRPRSQTAGNNQTWKWTRIDSPKIGRGLSKSNFGQVWLKNDRGIGCCSD